MTPIEYATALLFFLCVSIYFLILPAPLGIQVVWFLCACVLWSVIL